jgi:hypothetical protein
MLSPGKGLPVQERITSERFGHKGGNAFQLEQATELATDKSAVVVELQGVVYHRVASLTKSISCGIMVVLPVAPSSAVLLSYDREVMPMDCSSMTGAVASPQIIE